MIAKYQLFSALFWLDVNIPSLPPCIYQQSDLLAQFGITERIAWSPQQTEILRNFYQSNPYPTQEDRISLATQLGNCSLKNVQNWFLWRRHADKKAARDKRK